MDRDNLSAREVPYGSVGVPADAPPCDVDVGRLATAPVAAYFAEFFENSPHDLFVLDARQDGRFVFEHINPALTKSTGYTYEMLVGKSPEEVLTPANISALAARYRACAETRKRVEYNVTAMTPIGEVTRHTILVPIVDRSGMVRKILGTSTNVTALRHTEAKLASQTHELRELVERLVNERALSELIIENSGDGIILVDTELRYLVWNRAIESIHGKTRYEVLGKTVFDVDPGFANHELGNAWRKAISGQRAEIRDFRRLGRFEYIVELAAGVGQTGRVDQRWRSAANRVLGRSLCGRSCQGLVAAEGIGLDHPAKLGEMIARPLALAIGAEAVRRRAPAHPANPLVNHIGPQPAGPGLAIARRQHRDWRVVGLDDRRRHDVRPDLFGQRHHPPTRRHARPSRPTWRARSRSTLDRLSPFYQ